VAELGTVPGLPFGRGQRAGAEAGSGHSGSIGNCDCHVSGRRFGDDPRGACLWRSRLRHKLVFG
jgi:hypothetical protein